MEKIDKDLYQAVIDKGAKEIKQIIADGATIHKTAKIPLVELAILVGNLDGARALIEEGATVQPRAKEVNRALNLSDPQNIEVVKKYLGEEYAARDSKYLGQDDGMNETFIVEGEKILAEKFDANLGLVAASNIVSDTASLQKEVAAAKKVATAISTTIPSLTPTSKLPNENNFINKLRSSIKTSSTSSVSTSSSLSPDQSPVVTKGKKAITNAR